MSARPTLAVTGASGYVGGHVAHRLADLGVPTRLIVRDPRRAPELPGAHIVTASYGSADAHDALAGVQTLFMVSAAESATRLEEQKRFIDDAATAGVQHVVYLSFITASADSVFTLGRDHWHTEQHIRASGMAYTFLRDNLYADFLPALAGADGSIRGPAGDGAVGAVARDDVVDVATAVLTRPEIHVGATYRLTGPEALTLSQVADTLTAITGRPCSYHEETLEEAYESRASYGAPPWQVEAWVSTYTAIAQGEFSTVTGEVAALSGHPPRSVEDVVRAAEAR